MYNLHWIYNANRGYLTVKIINFYSRFIAGAVRHSLRDTVVSLSECRSVPAIK